MSTAPRQRRSSGPFRGQERSSAFRRVSHGLYRPATDQPPFDELLLDLAAWLLVLPDGAAFTHLTGALLRGWDVPTLPDRLPVFVAVRGDVPRPRRPGLVCARLVGDQTREVRHGLPVDPAAEILLRAARDLGVLDLVVLVDAALRAGDLSADAMRAILDSRRPGVRALRDAWALRDPLAQSAGETVLRTFHHAAKVPVASQVVLHGEGGAVVAQVDLLVTGTRHVHEYDGAHHRDGLQHRIDLRRQRALLRAGFQPRGFTLDDLLNHPAAVMQELDRALGRRHDVRRVASWRRLVGQSLYSAAGRTRLVNRWQRRMGTFSWGPGP
ncbi:hypothetical protein [Nocardioides sp. SYSU D00038]|uniref:hypothetical protein n=1 Tax=Nocardioides sp. SYSU D00038 TaxID=2812554 RepID=UPI0019671916|nr:hypothetical protein [Nocardioides sp. SYSU D00038]